MPQHASESAIVWAPDQVTAMQSAMWRFMRYCEAPAGRQLDWPALYRWSVDDPAAFWLAFLRFAGLPVQGEPACAVDDPDRMPGAHWFTGVTLNYAECLLAAAPATALIHISEAGVRQELTREELLAAVAGLARSLRELGVEPGDRIAAVLPNRPETAVIMLAAASIGAVFSSCSPDFGLPAILARFRQIDPVVLFCCASHRYGGRLHDDRALQSGLRNALPGVRHRVSVTTDETVQAPDGWLDYAQLLTGASTPVFQRLPFERPLFVLYSSGTTGPPKCIVHGAGGSLLQHCKEHRLHTDLRAGERLFYYTTCGWMMWNWLVSALASGVTPVLYDGAPGWPEPGRLWQVAAAAGVQVFGTSPGYLLASARHALRPAAQFDLARLRTILSTGAPLPESSFDYVREAVGAHIQLSSISGGTDILGCFALGNPLLPVRRGELQGPGLGMAVAVFDESGRPLQQGCGELVCTRAFPSMPLGFHRDADGTAYRRAYFERFPGIWAHGDRAEWTVHGGLRIHGRSDAVLNPGGVRIGSAEVCDPALELPEVVDAIAVGQRRDDDERIVLAVVLREGCRLDAGLEQRIRAAVRSAASPRHVPAVILAVPEIPRTFSGKAVELAVRSVIHDEPVSNLDAIANPRALEAFRGRVELR